MQKETNTGNSNTAKLLEIIRNNTEGGKEVILSSNLRDDLDVDSFGTLMIIDAIEDEFNITVADTDFENIITVADILAVMEEKHLNQRP
jgi:acyl carrier protein